MYHRDALWMGAPVRVRPLSTNCRTARHMRTSAHAASNVCESVLQTWRTRDQLQLGHPAGSVARSGTSGSLGTAAQAMTPKRSGDNLGHLRQRFYRDVWLARTEGSQAEGEFWTCSQASCHAGWPQKDRIHMTVCNGQKVVCVLLALLAPELPPNP